MLDLLQELKSFRLVEKNTTICFNQLKVIPEDLENTHPIPPCTWGSRDSFKQQWKNEYIICFLKGLSGKFTIVRTQILCKTPCQRFT